MTEQLPDLEPNQLEAILAELADRFSWSPGMSQVEATSRWQSRKARFHRVTTAAGRQIIVKLGVGWTQDDAEFVHSELARLTTLVADLDIAVPQPLGWAADPPLVVMGVTDGAMLCSEILPEHDSWPGDLAQLTELVTRCGRAIGRYHAAQPAPQDESLAAAARADLRRASRRSLVRRTPAVVRASDLPRARGFRFSPNDFLVGEHGELILLDPPHVRKYDYVHRDISSFTFEVDQALRKIDRKTAAALNRAFLEGYADEGLCDPTADRHRWAVRLYEVSRISGLAYGRVRSRRFTTAAATLAWAARQRLTLGLSGLRTPH